MTDESPNAYFGFPLPDDLRERIIDLTARVRSQAGDEPPAQKDLAALVSDLTGLGLRSYFLEPVQKLGAGPVSRKVVRLGVQAAESTLGRGIHRVLGSLDPEQLRQIADLLEGFLLEGETEDPGDTPAE